MASESYGPRVNSCAEINQKLSSIRSSSGKRTALVTSTRISSTIFSKYPVEIWHIVAKELDMSDQAALVLTCKDSLATFGYSKVLELRQPNQRMELLKLLFRLADKFPEHYLCGACTRFHPRKTAYKNYVPPPFHVLEDEHIIEYSQVLAAIEDKTKINETELDWRQASPGDGGWNVRYYARVEEDHIILRVLHTLFITTAVQTRPRLEVVPTCHHLNNPTTLIDKCQNMINRTPRPWESHINVRKARSRLYRCPYCPSEYRVVVSRLSRSEVEDRRLVIEEGASYMLSVNRYVDIGKAYSPHTEAWAALTRPRPAGLRAIVPYDLQNGLESALRRYSEMEGRNPDDFEVDDSDVKPLLD